MKDPERLADADASVLARRMLSSAREEAPSHAAFERTVARLGVGAVVFGASATASVAAAGAASTGTGAANAAAAGLGGSALSGAAKAVPSGLLFGAVKWLGIGAVGGLVTAGVADHVASIDAPAHDAVATTAATRNASEVRPAPARAGLAPPPLQELAVPEFAAEPAAKPKLPRATRTPAAHDSPEALARQARLAAEVEAVDRARVAMARGNAAQALSALEAYERGFAEQRLRPEALYLRMEALLRLGDDAGARAAARAVLAADPQGPHAARAREMLGSGR